MASVRPTTVAQLLTASSLGRESLLGGVDGLEHPVGDVVLRSPARCADAPANDMLVVIDGTEIGDHAYVFDQVLRRVAERQGAGVIIASPAVRPDLGTVRLANRFRIPFMVVNDRSAMELCNDLRTVLWASEVEGAALVAKLLQELALMRLRDAEAVVEAVSKLINTPIALVDRNRQVFVGAPIAIAGRRLAENLGHFADASESTDLHSTPLVLAPGEEIAYWLVAETSGPAGMQRNLQIVLQITGWYLSTILAGFRLRTEREARRRIAVLNEVLDASDRPEHDLHRLLADMGWTLTGWNMAFHLKLTGSDSARAIEMQPEVQRRLDAEGVTGPIVERSDGWSGWINSAHEPSANIYSDITSGVRTAVVALCESHPGLVAHGGIGRPYEGVAGLRRSLIEAQQAAVMASARNRSTPEAEHIDQLGVRRVLLGWYASDEFRRFARNMLAPLLRTDRDGALLATLEAFLDAGASTTMAADALHVHRNTVANRVRRVEQLLGVDLSDPEVRLSLQLAARVLQLAD